MQLDLAVLQLCNDCVVVKVLRGVVELPDKRIPLLVLSGIVELQLVSKELRLQGRLQRRRERDREGREEGDGGGRWRREMEAGDGGGRWRRERQRRKINIYSCNYVLSSYQTLCVHFTSHEHNTCKVSHV